LIRKCKHCDQEAKRNIINGRNKGFLKTCGSSTCLVASHRSEAVIAAKKFQEIRQCEKCSVKYTAESSTQRWCKPCAPNKTASTRLQRYNVSQPEFDAMKAEQDGLCAICRIEPASFVDHNHETGEVRQLLCCGCNSRLAVLEDDLWKQKAEAYLEKHRAIRFEKTGSIFTFTP